MSRYTWIEDVIVEDDPNKEVRGRAILLHNQGTFIIEIGQQRLLPDDQAEIVAPGDDKEREVTKILRIKFLGAATLNNPVANYPQLWPGRRLLISELKKIGSNG